MDRRTTNGDGGDDAASDWQLHLILNNIQKPKNIRNMLISASLFGVRQVFVVGQKKNFSLEDQQPFLAKWRLRVVRMETLAECAAHCRERNIRICGVEILERSKSVLDEPFSGHTALIMGNEGSGMNSSQLRICDDLVYIPQYGDGTASLNVSVAASLVMHRFALWRSSSSQ